MLLKGAEHYGFEVDLWTTERVASLIEERFGVRYHPDHVRKILHGKDFTSQKVEGRPGGRVRPLAHPTDREDVGAERVHAYD